MTDKKPRTPKNAEAILKGALSLPLAERVEIKNKLNDSIAKEVKDLQDAAAEAEELLTRK